MRAERWKKARRNTRQMVRSVLHTRANSSISAEINIKTESASLGPTSKDQQP